MPSTRKQMRAAGKELRLRREGKVKQQANRAQATRPMGAMSDKNLESYASWPDPTEQRELARREMEARAAGSHTNTGFAKASVDDVFFYASASDEAIRRKNGQSGE